MLEADGDHGLCFCQPSALLTAMEAAFGGFGVEVFVLTTARLQQIEAGTFVPSFDADAGRPLHVPEIITRTDIEEACGRLVHTG